MQSWLNVLGGPQVYTLTGADQPYRLMVEEMQEGAVALRDDCIIMYSNKQIARMLHTSHRELAAGLSFRNFVAAESLPFSNRSGTQSHSEPSRGEVTLRCRRRHEIAIHLTVNALASDEPAQTSVVITDLTEQKRHQEIVAAEAFAREKAIELAEADRRKDEFWQCWPTNSETRWGRSAMELTFCESCRPDGEQAMQILGMMEEQAHNLVRLIDDLLDVSRCGQGKLELRRQRVALPKIITSAIQTAQPLIHANGHELTVTQAGESLHVHGDPTRLTQVISNLLNNAARYTPRGGNILLTTERIGDEVAIRVKDNGAGIAAGHAAPDIRDVRSGRQFFEPQAGRAGNRPDSREEPRGNARRHRRKQQAMGWGRAASSPFACRSFKPAKLFPKRPNDSADTRTIPCRRILIVDDMRPVRLHRCHAAALFGQQVRTAGTERKPWQ